MLIFRATACLCKSTQADSFDRRLPVVMGDRCSHTQESALGLVDFLRGMYIYYL